MRRCLLIINKVSGNAQRVMHGDGLVLALKKTYDEVDIEYIEENAQRLDMEKEAEGYDALAVCGGDGTFNSAINALRRNKDIELIYLPCGTLNDAGKALKLASKLRSENRQVRRVDIGEIGDSLFSYVAAAGIFTAIGYTTKTSAKKRFKLFAYFFTVLKEYKIHRIKAKIELGDRVFSDEYTLILAINSSRCFGFSFNKLYKHNSGKGHLLLIKAPKEKGIIGKIKVFFPLFRAFFIGFKKEVDTENLKFIEFDKFDMELEKETIFTVDGERLPVRGKNEVKIHKQRINLYVY